MASGAEALMAAGLGIGSLITGVVYGVLGLFTMRGSRIALGIAMALYALDGFAGMLLAAGGGAGMGGLFVRIFFLAAMGRAFMTMGAGDKPSEDKPSADEPSADEA